MARYVVRYEIRTNDPADPTRSVFVSMGERDVEVDDAPSVVSYRREDGRTFEAERDEIGTRNDPLIGRALARQLVIPKGHHAVITGVTEAPGA